MRIYSPLERAPWETEANSGRVSTAPLEVSDEQAKEFVAAYHTRYRHTLEQFFPRLCPLLPRYVKYPYHSRILRLGQGFIIGHAPSAVPFIEVQSLEDFTPPLAQINLFDILERWQSPWASFDLTGNRLYDEAEATREAERDAADDALNAFWSVLPPSIFQQIAIELLVLLNFQVFNQLSPRSHLLHADVHLVEPAGFRRAERWAFNFVHHPDRRVTAAEVREVEQSVDDAVQVIDVLCFVTSGDLTSIGNSVAVRNHRLRIWDRALLRTLSRSHPEVLAPYFPEYDTAVAQLGIASAETRPRREFERLRRSLQTCRPGQPTFATYEQIGTDYWSRLFAEELSRPKVQRATADGVQRRDVIYRNLQKGNFWRRIRDKFGADFVIVDFKNYGQNIKPADVEAVAKYANEQVGRFAVVLTRKGALKSVRKAQHRILRDNGVAVLVVTDAHLMEMGSRRVDGLDPADVLEDLLDEMLLTY